MRSERTDVSLDDILQSSRLPVAEAESFKSALSRVLHGSNGKLPEEVQGWHRYVLYSTS